jgi:hypothetical protein
LTATPNIIFKSYKTWGVNINKLNSEVLVKYKVKSLKYTKQSNLPSLFKDGTITGKTIIMCYSVKNCFELSSSVPNSAALISKSNKKYKKEDMDQIRECIINSNSLPDCVTVNGKKQNLDVLICTSTLREGINLYERSGIKNVICCIPDELHITQFVGRCRFDIENLIIAEEYIPESTKTPPYIQECRMDFENYLKDKRNDKWFKSIKHILADDITGFINLSLDKKYFNQYIVDNWLDKRIFKDEEKNQLIEMAIICSILDIPKSRVTFISVIHYLEEMKSLHIKEGRMTIDGKKYTYKLIEKINRKVIQCY